MMRHELHCGILFILCASCGGGSPPPATTTPTEPEPPPTASEPTAAAPAVPEEPLAEPEPAEPAEKPRQVRYRMTPKGLVVEVIGARFTPKVKPIRVGGGWGLRVEVAGSVEDTALSVLAPKGGELAFAGTIIRAGDTNSFSDTRKGEEERFLSPGQSVTLKRDFPGKSGDKPLKKGDRLQLQVGLWGLGPDAKSRRPVRKLFSVAMEVGKKTPQPVISPPKL